MDKPSNREEVHQRELARQKHRRFALFALLQCWANDWAGLIASRDQMERLLGLNRFKGKRLQWMREDIGEAFPGVMVLDAATSRRLLETMAKERVAFPKGNDDSFQLLLLSRYPLEEEGTMEDRESSSRVGALILWDDYRSALNSSKHEDVDEAKSESVKFLFTDGRPDERILTAHLALLAQGVIPFSVFRSSKG